MEPITYFVRMKSGQQFYIRCNMAEGSAPIWATWFDPANSSEWARTPFNTSDANRSEWKAAVLIAEHFAEPGENIEVESVEAMEVGDDEEEEEEHRNDGEDEENDEEEDEDE